MTIQGVGPVLPGPPRLLELDVAGDNLTVGKKAIARAHYIGGHEGMSEYWWMRIKGGQREQITEPLTIPPKFVGKAPNAADSTDPRVYEIKQADVGSVLKVKCRPVRSDGHKGEVFTSKQSSQIS